VPGALTRPSATAGLPTPFPIDQEPGDADRLAFQVTAAPPAGAPAMLVGLLAPLFGCGRVSRYLYLVDRKAFMIISGGVNIYPQEAESVLVGHPKVADVAVISVPSGDLGEEVKVFVQLPDPGEAGPDRVRAMLAPPASPMTPATYRFGRRRTGSARGGGPRWRRGGADRAAERSGSLTVAAREHGEFLGPCSVDPIPVPFPSLVFRAHSRRRCTPDGLAGQGRITRPSCRCRTG
jgi:hypothetical protein